MPKASSKLPPLDLLPTFDAAARHLSFTKAAAERFLTQSAVSRQVKALEDDLGVALFRRRHRALDLTDDGRRLAAAVRTALEAVRGAVSEIRAPVRREVLSVTTTAGLASLWLIPRLAIFDREHPGIDVRIDASLERRDLLADGFDMAIRYTRTNAGEGIPLFHETVEPVCAPALARDRSNPLKKPLDLRNHRLLQVEVPRGAGVMLEWELWAQAIGIGTLETARSVTFNSYDTAIAAAVAGQGIALGRHPLVDALLKEGALVAPLQDELSSQRAYFLVVEPNAAKRPAVRAFADWLVEQARST
jgi:LysR family glycine cleavage system transcriptional activator